jgi:hypothetical protein
MRDLRLVCLAGALLNLSDGIIGLIHEGWRVPRPELQIAVLFLVLARLIKRLDRV